MLFEVNQPAVELQNLGWASFLGGQAVGAGLDHVQNKQVQNRVKQIEAMTKRL